MLDYLNVGQSIEEFCEDDRVSPASKEFETLLAKAAYSYLAQTDEEGGV